MENTKKCKWRKGREAVNKWKKRKVGWDLDDSYDNFQHILSQRATQSSFLLAPPKRDGGDKRLT